MLTWRRCSFIGGDASACRKSQLPECAQHVANVCTSSGDRSGFILEGVAMIVWVLTLPTLLSHRN